MSRVQNGQIRILHILPELGRKGQLGGAERVAVELVKWFQSQDAVKWDVRLCVLGLADPCWASYGLVREPWALGHQLPLSVPALIHHARRDLRRLLQEFRPHIVHSHLWPADLVAACAVSRDEHQHVAHHHQMHTVGMGGRRLPLRRILYAVLLRWSRATFVACAEAVKKSMIKQLRFEPSRIQVIYNGIPSTWFLPEPAPARNAPPVVIGCAGRLQPVKGHDLLFRATRELINRERSVRVRIAGSGSAMETHRQLTSQLGIADQVEFLGRVHDMKAFYDQLDVYALPSLSEGLPLSILESMARSRPVVATRVGGIPEVIRDGENGLLTSPGDVRALAEALESVIVDISLRERLGRNGWQHARDAFSLARMADAIELFYLGLLS